MKLKNFETTYSIGDRVLVNCFALGVEQPIHHDGGGTILFFPKGDILYTEKGTIESIIIFKDSDGRFKVRYGIELDNYIYDNEYHVETGGMYQIERKLQIQKMIFGVEV